MEITLFCSDLEACFTIKYFNSPIVSLTYQKRGDEMSKNILIGTFGGGPGIITSFLDCFWEFQNLSFDKLILITTSFPKAQKGYNDFKLHIQSNCPVCKTRYKSLDTFIHTIDAEDIITEEDHHALLSLIIKHIRLESQMDANIYLGLVGGRRNMNVLPVFAGMLFPVAGLYDSVIKTRGIVEEAEKNAKKWNDPEEKPNDEKKKMLWKEASDLWGLTCNGIDKPPITLGWHYNVKEDFHLTRLPLIGLTPFLEGFIRIFKQTATSMALSEQTEEPQKDWTERWVEFIQKNQDVAEIIQSLQRYFESPIEEASTPILLMLEKNDREFWHECIKHGVKNPNCDYYELKGKWEIHKQFFIINKVVDPQIKEFDNLFNSSPENVDLEDVKRRFMELYLNLNLKIWDSIESRNKTLSEWLNQLVDIIEGEKNSKIQFQFHYCKPDFQNLKICIGPELEQAVKEVLRNALQHGKSKATIKVTDRAIILWNDGTFDDARWKKSTKSQYIQRVCEEYSLQFEIGSENNGIRAIISWSSLTNSSPSINAKTIIKGGNYAGARNPSS